MSTPEQSPPKNPGDYIEADCTCSISFGSQGVVSGENSLTPEVREFSERLIQAEEETPYVGGYIVERKERRLPMNRPYIQ